MNNELVKHEPSFDTALIELDNMQKMSQKLFQMKHYQKLGDVGIFAILQKAKSIGLNPLDALNGSMYFVNGKVELSANTMNYLIRKAGHSVVKDEKSTKEVCILKGKRHDNGDTFTCSFSIDDAKKAGIFKNVWQTYPEDMLFARALTRLARQLFPDVCKGCYIEGEIPRKEEDVTTHEIQNAEFEEVKEEQKIEKIKEVEYISSQEVDHLNEIISQCDPHKIDKIWAFLSKKCDGKALPFLKKECYSKIESLLMERRNEYQDSIKIEPLVEESEDAKTS